MLRYTIATTGTNTNILTTYGVNVSGTTGLIGRPDFKEPSHKYNWEYLNGEWIDLGHRRYKPRTITMRCWLKGATKQLAIEKLNNFLKAFDTDQLIRLGVGFVQNNSGAIQNDTKGLYYLVYLSKVNIKEYKWRSGKQILNFDITLVEPSPIKRIYKVTATDSGTVTATYTSTSEFDIHWGDGDVDVNLIGTSQIKTHGYTGGNFILIVTGVIGDISTLTMTASTAEITIEQLYEEI